mmetsp:Transcript_30341/g.58130  ORF Transcript_30341/g.58130 Transcript_30341/m.58130 type:complete len:212 (+) Transcript_30341:384-1019(+)
MYWRTANDVSSCRRPTTSTPLLPRPQRPLFRPRSLRSGMGPPTRSLASPSPLPSRTVSQEGFFSQRRRSRPPPPVRTPAGLHPRPRRVGRTPLLPFPSARRRRLHQPKVASRLHMDSLKRRVNEFYDDATRVRRLLSLLPPHLPVRTPVSAAPIYRIKHGGEVTYIGPSHLVVYPLLHLKRSPPYRMDLHWYLRQIEEVIVQTLKEFDVDS